MFYPVSMALLGWLYGNAPLAGVLVFFQILLYQNFFISIFSPGMARTVFEALQGTNFVAISLMAAIAFTRLTLSRDRDIRSLLWTIVFAVTLAIGYTLLGAAKVGPTSALIYFRSATTFCLAAIVGMDVGRVWGYRTVATGFLVSVVLSLILAYVEVIWTKPYYDLINAVPYAQIKSFNTPDHGMYHSAQDIINVNTADWFNFSGLDDNHSMLSYRYMGTVMHSISYAYVLTAAGLVAISLRRSFWMLAIFPLQMILGAKGGILVLLTSIVLWTIWLSTRSKQFLMLAGVVLITAYVGFGIRYGLEAGDYHVIGFMGGFHSLEHNPIGNGIGVGGNLSTTATVHGSVKWQKFQHVGADFALESAVGVLFYQMGAAAFALLAVFARMIAKAPLGKITPSGVRPDRNDILLLALATVAVNGVFQEEAYSPTGAGLFALLVAVLIANGSRMIVPAGTTKEIKASMPFALAMGRAPRLFMKQRRARWP